MGVTAVSAYPDACVLIYLLDKQSQLAEVIAQRVRPAQDLPPSLVFTELTRLECRIRPVKTGNHAQLLVYDQLFAAHGNRFQAMDRQVFELATQLRAEHGLKTADALHLAAAIRAGCVEFWTNDRRLAKAAQGRLQIVTFESTL